MFERSRQEQRERSSGSDAGHAKTSRRAYLATTAAASTGALTGCVGLLGDSSETLRVTVWSGNYADRFEAAIKPIFEERTGATLQINRGWEEILAKIKSAPADDPPYDVTVTEGQLYHMGRQDDLFLPIRYDENVPNIENVIPYYRELRTPKYGAPIDGAPCVMVYRTDLDRTPRTWADFGSEFMQSSTGVGIDGGFWVFPLHAGALATDAVDGAGELYDEQYHENALDTVRTWNITGWASSGTDIWKQFDNGVIDAAQWYFDQTYYDIQSRDDLGWTLPEHNPAYMDNWSVVRGTDKRELAEQFINILLDAEVQSKWSEESPLFFTNENTEYAGDLGEYMPTSGEEAQKLTFPDWAALSESMDDFSEAFKEMKAQG